MLIVLGLAALMVGIWKVQVPAHQRVLALWVGFMIGVTITLFAFGGGSLFPIVLVVAAGLSALTVLAGGLPM